MMMMMMLDPQTNCRSVSDKSAVPTYSYDERGWISGRTRPPTDASSLLSFAAGCPPVGSCSLDPTQALAGRQAADRPG